MFLLLYCTNGSFFETKDLYEYNKSIKESNGFYFLNFKQIYLKNKTQFI